MDANHEPFGEIIPNVNDINCSHGICRECYATMKEKIRMEQSEQKAAEQQMAAEYEQAIATAKMMRGIYDAMTGPATNWLLSLNIPPIEKEDADGPEVR